jgi:parvulin-like peptidyl-prolyl isomerase
LVCAHENGSSLRSLRPLRFQNPGVIGQAKRQERQVRVSELVSVQKSDGRYYSSHVCLLRKESKRLISTDTKTRMSCAILSIYFIGLTAISVPLVASSPDKTTDPVVLSLGDTKFTAAQVEKFIEAMPQQFRPFYSGAGKAKLAELLLSTELLVREAKKRHLETKPDVQLQVKIATDSILSNAAKIALKNEMTVTDAELQKYLEEHKSKFEEAHARRIVIRSKTSIPWDQSKSPDQLLDDKDARARANDLREQLAKGADFEELAAKYSDDSLSSGKGGDLGFNRRGSQAHLIVPPLEEKIFSMEPGTISEVMQTPLGYEIVKLEEKRLPKVSDIRQELEQVVLNEKTEDLLKELRSQEKVFVDNKFFNISDGSASRGK